jgi:myosin heavy subunit
MALSVHGTTLPDTGIEDMITLDNLTEETMLTNLKIRYQKNLIYVSTFFLQR